MVGCSSIRLVSLAFALVAALTLGCSGSDEDGDGSGGTAGTGGDGGSGGSGAVGGGGTGGSGGSVDPCEDVECTSNNECVQEGTCNPATGMCDAGDNIDDGTPCDADGAPGQCESGVCEEVDCDSDDDCPSSRECVNDGTCDMSAGVCVPGSNKVPGEECSEGGGSFCDGTGDCVECNDPGHCPDAAQCMVATCDDNTCGEQARPDGAECDLLGVGDGVCDDGECVEPPDDRLIIAHVGDFDPTSEGFGVWLNNNNIATAPIADDGGVAAWQITNPANPAQALYGMLGGDGNSFPQGSGLTQQQRDAILAMGFTLSLRARLVDGPTYESGSWLTSALLAVDGFAGLRFDIALGNDGAGNTTVVLPSSVVGPASSVIRQPPFETYQVPGTGYHLYQLSYDPTTSTASLYVDCVLVASDYPGYADPENWGVLLGTVNGASANFALAKLEAGQLSSCMVPQD